MKPQTLAVIAWVVALATQILLAGLCWTAHQNLGKPFPIHWFSYIAIAVAVAIALVGSMASRSLAARLAKHWPQELSDDAGAGGYWVGHEVVRLTLLTASVILGTAGAFMGAPSILWTLTVALAFGLTLAALPRPSGYHAFLREVLSAEKERSSPPEASETMSPEATAARKRQLKNRLWILTGATLAAVAYLAAYVIWGTTPEGKPAPEWGTPQKATGMVLFFALATACYLVASRLGLIAPLWAVGLIFPGINLLIPPVLLVRGVRAVRRSPPILVVRKPTLALLVLSCVTTVAVLLGGYGAAVYVITVTRAAESEVKHTQGSQVFPEIQNRPMG
jgi:hypothetical protein